MKNFIHLLLIICLIAGFTTQISYQETWESFTFQGIVRNNQGTLITNSSVSFRFSFIETSETGPVAYQETQTVTTNQNGLATLRIGEGTVISGDFNLLDWSSNTYFLKTEIDPIGGSNYTISDIKKMNSVAYAKYANKALTSYFVSNLSVDNATLSGNGYTTPLKLASQNATTGQVLKYNGTSWIPGNDNSDQYWYYTPPSNPNYPETGRLQTIVYGRMGFGYPPFSSNGFHFRHPNGDLWLESTGDTDANFQIMSAANKSSVINFNQGWNMYWQIGSDPSTNFYIWRNGMTHLFTIDTSGDVNIYRSLTISGNSNNNMDLNVSGNAAFSGSVGIGTTSPTNKLSVNGNANFAGNIGLSGYSPVSYASIALPATLGTKILLYPGSSGFAGLGVYANEVRLHTDVSVGKVSFGWADNSGNYTEYGKFYNDGNYRLAVYGNIWANGTTYSSDERFKKNITSIENPLNRLSQINGVEYEMNTNTFPERNFQKGKQMGLIAQNVEKVVPEAVSENEDGYKGVDYARLVPLLIESIKEQQKEIEELQKQIKILENK